MGLIVPHLHALFERVYGLMLYAFPPTFRARYGHEMRTTFSAALDAEYVERGPGAVFAFLLRELRALSAAALRERRQLAIVQTSATAHGGAPFWSAAYHDLRTTVRTLRRSAGFALLTVTTLTLALTINVVVFSMLHAVRNPVLPYQHPERLVVINEAFPPNGWTQQLTSFATYRDLERGLGLVDGLAVYNQRRVSLAVGDGRMRVQAAVVSSNLWPLLGVSPALGAGFTAEDARRGSEPTVIIGDRVWRNFFGADRNVLGRTALVDGTRRVIVGVMPAGFRFPEAEDLWLPLGTISDARMTTDRSVRAWQIVGRVKDGVSPSAVSEALSVIAARLEAEFPRSNAGWVLTAVPIAKESYESTGAFFAALQAGGLLLMALMCSNLGNLLLARGEHRRRELAICASLGAPRSRLVRLLLVEVTVLAGAGVALALPLASWTLASLPRVIPESIPFYIQFRLDGVVVLFTAALALATAVLAGFGAALRATRGDPHAALAQGTAALVVAPGGARMRFAFLFAQAAIAAALLGSSLVVGFGLLRFNRVDLGFDPRNTLLLEIPLPSATYPDDGAARVLVRTVIERLSSAQNVSAAAISAPLGVFAAEGESSGVEVDRRAGVVPEHDAPTTYRAITAQYFRVSGIRILSGRPFADADRAGAEDVVIVNAEAARRLFGQEPPEGRRIRFGRAADQRRWRTVIGVAANTTEQPLDPETEPRVFVPFDQDPGRSLTLAVRSPGPAEALSRSVLNTIRVADPALATEAPTTAERRLANAMWPLRFFAAFAACFSTFAIAVACSGVYGLTRYLTLARTREIALRLALGAGLSRVVLMIVRQNGTPVFAGLLLGLAAAGGVSSMLQHIVAGAPSFDAAAIAIAAAALGLTAAVALTIPALHARRVDPADALKVS